MWSVVLLILAAAAGDKSSITVDYDKFEDKTTYLSQAMRIKPTKGPDGQLLAFVLSCTKQGKAQSQPAKWATLSFVSSSRDGTYVESHRAIVLHVLADGKKVTVVISRYERQDEDGKTNEYLYFNVPVGDLMMIGARKSVEMELGDTQFKLTPDQVRRSRTSRWQSSGRLRDDNGYRLDRGAPRGRAPKNSGPDSVAV